MADIKLARPTAGQNVVVPSAPDARMVLDFAADQVSIDRPEGSDSLFFRFDDGSSIELQNFYTQYNKEAIPSFEVDGQLIAGADFFNAFGPDLAPAAGPAAGPTRSGRYSDFANSGLEDGVNHLDGLDYRLAFGGEIEPPINPNPLITNSAPTLSTGGSAISLGITEAGVGKPHMAPITGSFTVNDPDGDSITATVNLGGTSVAINGVTTVATNFGTLIITPQGGGSNVTYQFSYEVNDNPVDPLFKTADPRTDGADSLAEGETHTEVITITVSDGMGHTITQPINITITGSNDAPDIRSFEDMTLKDDGHFAGAYGTKDDTNVIKPAENDATTPSGIDGAHHLLSAVGTITAFDPDHNAVLTYGINTAGSLTDVSGNDSNTSYTVESYTAPGNGVPSPTSIDGCDTQIKTDYGTLYLNSTTGKYEFVVDPKADATNHLAEGQAVTLSFLPTVTDEHGATDTEFGVMRNSGTPGGGANGINITIMGSNDVPVIQNTTWGDGINVVTEDSNNNLFGGKVVGTDVDANETSTLRYGFFHPDSSGSESGTMVQTLYVVPTVSDADGTLHYTLSTSAPQDGNFYGTLAIDQTTGSYSFTLNNSSACVQALDNDADNGSSLGVSFPVVVKDDFGAYSKQNVNLTINGQNDAPEFKTGEPASYAVTVKDTGVYAAGAALGTLNAAENDGTLPGGVGDGQHQIEASGKIVINDVDNGDNAHTAWGVVTTDGSNGKVGEKSTDLGTGATKTFYVLGDDSVTNTAPTETDNNYYGTLTVKDDGSYTFKANTATGSPVDKLGETATHPITVNLYANDGQATTTSSLSITIKGSNEAPTVNTNSWTGHDAGNAMGVTLNEAANSTENTTVTGNFVAKDVDTGDSLHYGITTPATATVPAGGTTVYSKLYVVLLADGTCKTVSDAPGTAAAYPAATYVGEFDLTETGSPATGANYSFTLYNGTAAVQGLQNGDVKTASVTLVAQDNNGAYVKQDVSVTIKGSNDTPTVTPPEAAAMSVVESGVHLVGTDYNAAFAGTPDANAAVNTFKVSDVDNGDTQAVSITIKDGANNDVTATMHDEGNGKYTIATAEGTFTLTASAPVAGASGSSTAYSYSYALDNLSTATQSLNVGETRDYTFTVTITDSQGAKVAEKISLTITGTNDQPSLHLAAGAGGVINAADGAAAYTVGENTAISGGFTVTDVDGDGKSVDAGGLTDLVNHKISLSLDNGSVNQGVALTPTATDVTQANADYHGDATIATNYGVLTVKHDGTYSFAPNADFLDKGDQVTLNFKVLATDLHGANDTKTISVTLNGENDDPTGGSTTPVSLKVVESGASGNGGADYYNYLKPGGPNQNAHYKGKDTDGNSFTVKDVDAHDTQTVSLLLGGTAVTLEKNANGELVYHGQYGDFIITPSGGSYNADGSLSASNTGNGITYTYKYVLDNAKVNSLGANDDLDYDFKVVVTDSAQASTSQEVNVTVDTVNDIPLIGYSSVSVSEAGVKTGNTTYTGIGQAYGKIPGGYDDGHGGKFYDPDNAASTLTFHVAGLTDGTNSWGVVAGTPAGHGGTQLALNITGTDENGASISRAVTVSILGESSITVAGVEHQVIVTSYGVLDLITSTGVYTFNAQPTAGTLHNLGISDAEITNILNNINHLAQGETLSFSFQATATDPGNLTGTHMIGITIAGTNDKPALTMGYAPTLVGHASATDTNGIAYEQLEIRDGANSAYGAAPATLAYALGNATSTDADNHANAFFGVAKGHVTDGSGTLPDAGLGSAPFNTTQSNGTGTSAATVSVDGDYGTLTIDANGNYKYTMNASMAGAGGVINKLTATEHLDDSFTVLVKDEFGAWTTKAVTVRIDGVNDAPYLLDTTDISGTVTESGTGYTTTDPLTGHGNKAVQSSATVNNATVAGTNTIVGKFHVADDDSDLATTNPFSLDATGSVVGTDGDGWATYKTDYGYFHLNTTTGDYTFVLDNTLPAVQALQQGDSKPVNIPIAVTDAYGAKLTFNYALTVKGTNDQPVLTLSTTALTVTDGDTLSYSPSGTVVSVVDPDTSDTKTFGIVANTVQVTDTTTPTLGTSVNGSYGTFTVNATSGAYTYTLADNLAAVTKLDAGETLIEKFQVAVRDSKGAFDVKTITVTINGKEDPTIVNTSKLAPDHNVIESGVLPSSATDALHAHNNYTDGAAGVVTTFGYIGASDADTSDNTALTKTTADAKLHYVIQVTDHNGTGTTSDGTTIKCDLNILINATNLRTASMDANGHLTDQYGQEINVGDAVTVNGLLVIKLEDGSLTITKNSDSNGVFKYTYTLDNTDADVQTLNFHGTGSDGFSLLVTDTSNSNAVVANAPVTITIEGANDRPIITAVPGVSINENTAVSAKGQVSITDYEQHVADTHVSNGFNFSLVSSASATTGDSPVMQGTYGRLVLNQATGEYQYYRTANLTGLNDDDSVTDTFYVRVMDKDGAYSSVKPITITINGVDQPGTMSGGGASIKEDGVTGDPHGTLHYTAADKLGANDSQPLTPANAHVSGQLQVSDPDTNKDSSGHTLDSTGSADTYSTFTYGTGSATLADGHGTNTALSVTHAAGSNTYTVAGYGTLTVASNGSYSFDAATKSAGTLSDTLNSLAQGETVTLTLPATTHSNADGTETVTGNIVVTISGTNDVPVVDVTKPEFKVSYTDEFTGSKSTAEFETLADADTAVDYLTSHTNLATDYVNAHKSDLTNALLNDGSERIRLGLVTSNAVKHWVNSFVNGKADSDDYADLNHFLTHIGRGTEVSTYLTTHVDHAVVVDSDETASWSNISPDPVVRGSLDTTDVAKDVDHNADLKFFALSGDGQGNVVQQIQGTYGTLVISPNGTYEYVLDRAGDNYANFAYNHSSGETTTETFTIYVRDEHNAVAAKPIDLVIKVGDSGCYSSGDSYDVTDTINSVTNSVTEDFKTVATGSVAKHPGLYESGLYLVDSHGDHKSAMTTSYGTVTLLPDGSYSYVLNNDHPNVQALGVNDTITETFKVTNGQIYRGLWPFGHYEPNTDTITITIHGTNDTPYVVSQGAALAFAQGAGSTGWTTSNSAVSGFVVNDVDNGDTAKLILTGTGVVSQTNTVNGQSYEYKVAGSLGGTFYVHKSAAGSYTYTYEGPANNYKGSAADSASVFVTDPSGSKVEVKLTSNLTAANDTPVLHDATATVTEDGGSAGLVASGLIAATDADKLFGGGADSLAYKIVGSGGNTDMVTRDTGTLMMQADGSYKFYLNNSSSTVQSLGAGETRDETFTVAAIDGSGNQTTTSLTVTIHGTNDVPVLSLHSVGNNGSLGAAGSGAIGYVTDGAASLVISGKAVAYDADSSDVLTLHLNDQTLLLDKTATGGAVQSVTQDVYAYKDSNGWHQVSGSVTTDANGKLVDSAGHTVQHMGQFELSNTGSYTFTGDTGGISHMGQGEKLNVGVGISVTDKANTQDSGSLTISITGTNDKPVIEALGNHDLTDNGAANQSITGTITGSDAEDSSMTYYIKTAGGYTTQLQNGHGTLQISGDGYTYTMDSTYASSLAALAQDATTAGGSFSIVAVDKNGAVSDVSTLNVTLHGVNNVPTITTVPTNGNFTGTVVGKDVDTGETASLHYAFLNDDNSSSQTHAGTYGSITIGANGAYTYTLDPTSAAYKALAGGQNVTETFKVLVTDVKGASSTYKDLVIKLTGTNDAPENLAITQTDDHSGSLAATDVDTGDSLHYAILVTNSDGSTSLQTTIAGTYGSITIDANGNYDYTLNTASDAYKSLADSQSANETFKVVAVDNAGLRSTSKDLTFQVNGINDAPEVAAAALVALDVAGLVPDADITASITAAHDVDGDKLTYTVAGHGDPSFDNSGTGTVADIQGEFGTLIFNPHSGTDSHDHFTYKLDTSEEGLIKLAAAHADGSNLTETFSYSAEDTHHASSSSTITVNLDHSSPANSDGSIGHADATSAHLLFGASGDDTMWGGTGNDILSGGDGDDTLYGGAGNDYLFGGAGNDHLHGGAGNDHLYGGAGNDVLDGGAGNDFLDGGTGTNTLLGGEGNDILVHHAGDTISGGQGIDVLLTANADDDLSTLLSPSSVDTVEVAIKGTSANPDAPLSLTDLSKLANVGINISDTADGTVMTLSDQWTSTGTNTFTNSSAHLELTTNLSHDPSASVEEAKFLLTNS